MFGMAPSPIYKRIHETVLQEIALFASLPHSYRSGAHVFGCAVKAAIFTEQGRLGVPTTDRRGSRFTGCCCDRV